MTAQVGLPAPAFNATAYDRAGDAFQQIGLADYRGKWLLFYLYPLDFAASAAAEIAAFDEALDQFRRRGCELLACSTDSQYVHKAWCDAAAELAHLRHPLLADLTKRIAMDYGVLVPDAGVALPAAFLIDPKGIVRWLTVNDPAVSRNVVEALRALDALQADTPAPQVPPAPDV